MSNAVSGPKLGKITSGGTATITTTRRLYNHVRRVQQHFGVEEEEEGKAWEDGVSSSRF